MKWPKNIVQNVNPELTDMNHPNELEWIEGDLPDVHTVPKDCSVLVWFVNNITQKEWDRCAEMSHNYPDMIPPSPDFNGHLIRIEMCSPHGNDLNPIRWCDSSQHPIGYHEKALTGHG